jgi:hypothetical protein
VLISLALGDDFGFNLTLLPGRNQPLVFIRQNVF